MPVKWTVRSEEVHHSIAKWNGVAPKDGGKALLNEAFDFIHSNKQPGRMIVDFGPGGSVRQLEYIQTERTDTPPFEFETGEDDSFALEGMNTPQ